MGILAFALYRATLLPGVDFGDTGSFQTTMGSAILSPRVGYPLYFAIADAFLRVSGFEPAHALNVVSAIEGAIACGLFVVVAAELSGSVLAAGAAAAMLAVSYTFWSQSLIAEVYALHLALILTAMWLILRWDRHPSLSRLAAFFACYALAFGNHLSTILLAPAFTTFLLWRAPGGWRSMFRPRVVALAVVLAAAGALQYAWNIRSMWFQSQAPASIAEAIRTFWFDVTKSDWRDTMVLEVPRSLLTDHAAMYWFDLHQQFGLVGVPLAAGGVVFLLRTAPKRAILLLTLYGANVLFAFSYNVGDAHVFYLPSHLFVALAMAAGVAWLGALHRRALPLAALAIASLAVARGYHDYPALDRSGDRRPTRTLQALTADVDDQRAVLVVDLNWQVANGLSYFAKSVRPEIAVARARDVLLYAPALVRDNLAAGRNVVATAQARRILMDSYGPLLPSEALAPRRTLDAAARAVAPGTRYALCVVRQSIDMPIDRADVIAALRHLGSNVDLPETLPAFVVVAGFAGSPATVARFDDRPFQTDVLINGTAVEIRMEAWMTSDTIRRMGFGHVIAARHHTLIVERGVSFVTFDRDGSPIDTAYFASIFEPPQRYLVRTAW